MKKNRIIIFVLLLLILSCASVKHTEYKGEKFKITVASADVKQLNLNEQEVLQDIQSVLSESYIFQMFDRRKLEFIFKEKKLSLTGLVEEGNFSKIGEFSGIDGVVTLHSFQIGDTVYITMQLFNTRNAEILSSVFFKIPDASYSKIFQKIKEYSVILSNGMIERTTYPSKKEKTKVAVVLLEDLEGITDLKTISRWIPILESGLIKTFDLSVISRSQLEYIVKTQVKEKGLFLKDLLKKEDYNQIGNLSGVEYILIGSLNEIRGGCAQKFNLQAINTRTALTKNAERIDANRMEIGLTHLAKSMSERITQPRGEWKSYNESGSCD